MRDDLILQLDTETATTLELAAAERTYLELVACARNSRTGTLDRQLVAERDSA